MNTGIKILLAVFLLLAIIGGVTYSNRNKEDNVTLVKEVVTESFPVRVKKMAPKKVVRKLDRAATVEAAKDVTLNAEVSGRVRKIHLELGDACRKGALLVSLEREPYQIAVLAAKAALKQAEVALSQAQKNESRISKLEEKDVVTAHDAELAATSVQSAEARVAEAESGHRLASRNLKETRIVCPFDGRVAEMHVELGQSLGPGTTVARIVDTEALELTIAVSAAQLSRMAVGQKVSLTTQSETARDTVTVGKVAHLGVAADTGTGLFPVEVAVDNSGGTLRPGMVVRATCELGTYEGVLAIGRDVLLKQDEEPKVFVVEGGRARQRKVETGELVGDEVLIEQGLKKGEQVVVFGQDALTDGSTVSIVASTADENTRGKK